MYNLNGHKGDAELNFYAATICVNKKQLYPAVKALQKVRAQLLLMPRLNWAAWPRRLLCGACMCQGVRLLSGAHAAGLLDCDSQPLHACSHTLPASHHTTPHPGATVRGVAGSHLGRPACGRHGAHHPSRALLRPAVCSWAAAACWCSR